MKKQEAIATIAVFIVLIFGLTLWNLFTPDSAFSYNENRSLQLFPKFSLEELFEGEWQADFETYLTDQFVGRDAWVSLYVEAEQAMQKKDVNNVFFTDDGGMIAMDTKQSVKDTLVEKNLNRLERFAEKFQEMLGTEHTSVMIVPTAQAVLIEQLPANGQDMIYDQLALLDAAQDRVDEQVWIDAESVMFTHKDEYIYYKTDHHWTMNGAFYAYQQWMAQKGYKDVQLEDYDISVLSEEFLGTTYSKAPTNDIVPDQMLAFTLKDALNEYTLRIDESEEVIEGLYDEKKLSEKDKYAAYVYGNTAITEIKGGEENGRVLMIYKDSYSHCFATLAAADFETVYLVDPRYYLFDIWQFAEEKQVTDVLFLFNAINFAQETNLYTLEE